MKTIPLYHDSSIPGPEAWSRRAVQRSDNVVHAASDHAWFDSTACNMRINPTWSYLAPTKRVTCLLCLGAM